MSDLPSKSADELLALVSTLCDDGLDEVQSRRLRELLNESDVARDFYSEAITLHALLYLDGRHQALDLPPRLVTDCRDALSPAASASHEESNVSCVATLKHLEEDALLADTGLSSWTSLRWGFVCAAVACSIALVLGRGLLDFRSTIDIATASPAPAIARQVAVLPERGEAVARIKQVSAARFRHEVGGVHAPKAGATLRQGRYELLGGIVEVEYDSGVSVVLMAPADFTMVDGMHLTLEEGRASADVPEQAIGFTIDTVGGRVVDLGTAFAVQARRDRDAEVHVFEGEVRIDMDFTSTDRPAPLHLQEGAAARINPLSPIPSGIDLDGKRFVRSLFREHDSYSEAILALDPAVYYRMEPTIDGNLLRDSSPNGADALIARADYGESPWTGGKVGAAFSMGGPPHQSYAVAPSYPKAPGDELSVIAWVYAESRPEWASIAKNWGHPFQRGQFHFGLMNGQGELAAHIADGSLDVQKLEEDAEVVAKDSEPFPLNSWQHVAMVADGEQLRLYRNGRQVASAPYESLYDNPGLNQLAVGTKLNDSDDGVAGVGWSMWDGRLDELAVFNHAIGPETIQQLYVSSNEHE